MVDVSDFFEEDEPLSDILRAWEEGEEGTTGPLGNHLDSLPDGLSRCFTPRESVVTREGRAPLPANL